MIKKIDSTRLLFDLSFFSRGKQDLLIELKKGLKRENSLITIYTPNAEQIVQSRENKEFLKILQSADILLPDSVGVVLSSRILAFFGKTQPLPNRITGVSLTADLLKIAAENELKVLIVGGRDYQQGIKQHFPETDIAWTPGHEDAKKPSKAEEKALTSQIKQLQPDLVFVAFGAPQQEKWIDQHRSLLEENGVKIAMAVGGSFDYLLGKVKRAPKFMRQMGLEWLFRLCMQPWRWRRQTRLLKFIQLTLAEAF